MGYCAWQTDSKFFIAQTNLKKAEKALNDFMEFEQPLEDHLGDYGFEVAFDISGNLIDLTFTGEKLTCQDDILEVLAPFSENGSYIEMVGEDFEQWRWVIKNGKIAEITPKIIWDQEEES